MSLIMSNKTSRAHTGRSRPGQIPNEMIVFPLVPSPFGDVPVRLVLRDAPDEEVLARMRARPNLLTTRRRPRIVWPEAELERVGDVAAARR